MTPKDRFLAAIRNIPGQYPDRVPVAPDMSNYISAKRTGLPFWDIYLYGKIPLWQAYMDAANYYGTEYWIGASYGPPLQHARSRVEYISKDHYDDKIDGMVRETKIRTPDGDLTTEQIVLRADPPSPTHKPIKNLQADWKKAKWMFSEPTGIDTSDVEKVRQACHAHNQAFGLSVGYPGFQVWMCYTEGGVEPLAFAATDCPEILDEWYEIDLHNGTKVMELVLSVKPDYVVLGGSGTITLASPELAAKYAIPALARYSRMAKAAGVATMLHSCGKSRCLVDMLAEGTQVELINPLEIPPMGDVDLAEVKRARGRQIAFMGNLHTTQVMLHGTPELVKQKSIEAMRAAGEGGGFILSTGDQCPRDTPDENLFAMVEAAKEYGTYDPRTGRLPKLS